jgi:hypothetical protein
LSSQGDIIKEFQHVVVEPLGPGHDSGTGDHRFDSPRCIDVGIAAALRDALAARLNDGFLAERLR